MSWEPYLSSQDSALLRRALGGRTGGSFLEIGAGNGGALVQLAKSFRLVVGTDLVRPSMSDWREAGANYVLADGASCVRGGAFDLVAFNPPYVTGEGEDMAVEGGAALEVPKRFLAEALRVVRSEGEVVFLLNGGAKLDEFRSIAAAGGFALRPLSSEKMFFEELTVYVASEDKA
jgi:release factor glutamine methyltransferase